MGGTFDPIHHGHLVAASEVAARFGLDEVIFVPTGQPWQKSKRDVSPAEDRYLMTVIATASNPRFTVSRVDIDRERPTYTVDTLRDLRDDVPGRGAVLHHRCGRARADPVVAGLARICSTSPTSSGSRARATSSTSSIWPHLAELPDDAVSLIEIPALAISSTDAGSGPGEPAGLVPGAGRGGAVHQQTEPLPTAIERVDGADRVAPAPDETSTSAETERNTQ